MITIDVHIIFLIVMIGIAFIVYRYIFANMVDEVRDIWGVTGHFTPLWLSVIGEIVIMTALLSWLVLR